MYKTHCKHLILINRPNGTDALVVAAIDFGTTYSGYAYTFKNEFEKDHLKIYTNQQWVDSETQFASHKTSTSILFDAKGCFDSFGFEAENKYADLLSEEEDEGWRFFKRFKMQLFEHYDIDDEVI